MVGIQPPDPLHSCLDRSWLLTSCRSLKLDFSVVPYSSTRPPNIHKAHRARCSFCCLSVRCRRCSDSHLGFLGRRAQSKVKKAPLTLLLESGSCSRSMNAAVDARRMLADGRNHLLQETVPNGRSGLTAKAPGASTTPSPCKALTEPDREQLGKSMACKPWLCKTLELHPSLPGRGLYCRSPWLSPRLDPTSTTADPTSQHLLIPS